jgi:predicted double-glycine peptidase
MRQVIAVALSVMRRRRTRAWVLPLALMIWLLALLTPTVAAVWGAPRAMPMRLGNPERITLGWQDVKRQLHDNTCGLAVLSLLLEWAGQPISETQLASQTTLTAQGMSLFAWQQLALKSGVRGKWLRVVPQALEQIPMPLVVQIKNPTGHFVLVRRVYNGHVLLADPNAGAVLYTWSEFIRVWTNRAFVLGGV